MATFTINGTSYNYKPGYTITRLLNETLDSGLIIIPQTVEIDIEPMDQVQLGTRYFYVATIRRRIAAFTPVKTYNYEIGLISPTIYLQRVILPNRSVTGTHQTIYDILQHYISIYAPTLSLHADLIARTNTVTCPEMQWTQPTLFEVFNDLLSVVGCVVTMTNFTTVSLLDLSTRGSEIDETTLNDDELTQSIEDYAKELEIDAKNAVYPETNIQTYERLVLKTTQSSLLTVDNAELILSKGIYNVDKITVDFYNNVLGSQSIDFTDHITEKTIYNAYKASNTLSIIDDLDYKRNAVYYTEGERIIGGFGYDEDGILGINTPTAMVNIICSILGETVLSSGITDPNDMLEFGFSVWYTSSENIKFRVKKDDATGDNVIINNQESSHADIRALAKSNQDTINRIGNPTRTIYGRYLDDDDIPEIGDTLGDYVLTSQTIKENVDYWEFTGELTKNYVMKNMFTAIRNSKRYTQYESAREAFLSEHITRYIVKATTTTNENYEVWETYLMMFGKKDNRLKYIVANIIYDADTPQEFLMNHSVHWLGNNVVRVNVKMDDNYSAGVRVERKTVFLVVDRYSVVDTPYVDDLGEFEAIELLLYKENGASDLNPNFTASTTVWRDEAVERARSYPLIDAGLTMPASNIVFDTDLLYRYKDNREITSETLQFYFNRDSHVYIGDYYYKQNPLHYNGDVDITLYIWGSTTETYADDDYNTAKGSIVSGIVRFKNSIRSTLSQTTWDTLGLSSWCVADGTGHVYFAINGSYRYLYLVSQYNYDPYVVEINDISISGIISHEATNGSHFDVDDIAINGLISHDAVKGTDAYFDDIEIEGVISTYLAAGDSVTINDIEISGVISGDYTYNADHFAIIDIEINGVISHAKTSFAPDNLEINDISVVGLISADYVSPELNQAEINDISISGVISSTFDAYEPDNLEINDITISGIISEETVSSGPLNVEVNDINVVGVIGKEHVGTELQWVSGGTVPVGSNECNSTDDVGNTRCTSICVFEEYDSYISLTNDSNSVSCVINDTSKITCVRQSPTQWLCTIYIGVQGYTDCEVCTLV